MDLNDYRRLIEWPLSSEITLESLHEAMEQDVDGQLYALASEARMKPKTNKLRCFHYDTVIDISNIKYVYDLMDVFHSAITEYSKSQNTPLEFMRPDIIHLLTVDRFEGDRIEKPIPGNGELDRFKIYAVHYPVVVTFRMTIDYELYGREEVELVVLVHTSDWVIPGHSNMFYAKNLVRVETNAKCTMLMSTVLHSDDPQISDGIAERCQRDSYKTGFRSSVFLPSRWP